MGLCVESQEQVKFLPRHNLTLVTKYKLTHENSYIYYTNLWLRAFYSSFRQIVCKD
jgi:hypothetical protein